MSRHVPPVSTSTTLGATYVDIGSVKFEPGVSLSAIELESPTAAALDAAPARNPIAKILRETQPNKPPPSPLPASSPRRSKGTVALSLSRTPASTSTTSFPTVSSRPSPTSSPPRARFRRSRRHRRSSGVTTRGQRVCYCGSSTYFCSLCSYTYNDRSSSCLHLTRHKRVLAHGTRTFLRGEPLVDAFFVKRVFALQFADDVARRVLVETHGTHVVGAVFDGTRTRRVIQALIKRLLKCFVRSCV